MYIKPKDVTLTALMLGEMNIIRPV